MVFGLTFFFTVGPLLGAEFERCMAGALEVNPNRSYIGLYRIIQGEVCCGRNVTYRYIRIATLSDKAFERPRLPKNLKETGEAPSTAIGRQKEHGSKSCGSKFS